MDVDATRRGVPPSSSKLPQVHVRGTIPSHSEDVLAAGPRSKCSLQNRDHPMRSLSDAREHPNDDYLEMVGTTQSSVVEYKLYRRRWAGLAVLMSMNLVISWGWLTFAPVSTATQEYFQLSSKTPVNWLSTIIFFTYIIISPVVIWSLNKHGIKNTIWIASVLTVIGFWLRYIGTSTGPGDHGNFWVVMMGQAFIGFAQPFVLNAPTYYSDVWFTSSGRVTATALASLSNPFGAAVGQLVNPFLATKASEIPNMVLYIAVIATVPALLAFFIPERPAIPPCASSAEKKLPLAQSFRLLGKSREFWTIFVLFAVYLGFFNAFSSLINQIFEPYGYTPDEAGYIGAVLIVVGLIASAIISPIIDRTHAFLFAIRLQVPLIALCYIGMIFAPTRSANLAAPMILAAILGSASFTLLPITLEYIVEQTHPISPEVTTTILWMGGQATGAIFLLAMDAMRDQKKGGSGGRPEGNMWSALVFEGVICAVVAPVVVLVKKRRSGKGRWEIDQEAERNAGDGGAPTGVLRLE